MRNIFIILFCVISLASFGQGNRSFYDTLKFKSPVYLSSGSGSGYIGIAKDTTGLLVWTKPNQYHYSRATTDTVTSLGTPYLTINDSVTTTSLLINFPSNPYDGQTLTISSIYAVSSGVVISPSVLGTITTLTANGYWGWKYDATLLKWVRKN